MVSNFDFVVVVVIANVLPVKTQHMIEDEDIFMMIEKKLLEEVNNKLQAGEFDANILDEVSRKYDIICIQHVCLTSRFKSLSPCTIVWFVFLTILTSVSWKDGYSPLILASSLGLPKMVEMLITNKADLNYVAKAISMLCVSTIPRTKPQDFVSTGWGFCHVLRRSRGSLACHSITGEAHSRCERATQQRSNTVIHRGSRGI